MKIYYLLIISIFNMFNPVALKPKEQLDQINLECGSKYIYNKNEIKQQKLETKWCHKFFNFSLSNPYYSFLVAAKQRLNQPASKHSEESFANLNDGPTAQKKWNYFIDLKTALTSSHLSNEVTLDVNWEKIYQECNLVNNEIYYLKKSLLRFYNIIANVYQVKNILRLVQKTFLDNSLNYFSKTFYDAKKLTLTMNFNKEAFDQKNIDEAFNDNSITTNNQNVAPIREYGQALIFYAYNNELNRENFNSEKAKKDLSQKYFFVKKIRNNLIDDELVFHDVPESLISMINKSNIIDTNNDPIKKLLLVLLVVNSKESRMAWIVNQVLQRDSFFTESFCKWIATPSNTHNYAWQILNAYFIRFFPVFYNIF